MHVDDIVHITSTYDEICAQCEARERGQSQGPIRRIVREQFQSLWFAELSCDLCRICITQLCTTCDQMRQISGCISFNSREKLRGVGSEGQDIVGRTQRSLIIG